VPMPLVTINYAAAPKADERGPACSYYQIGHLCNMFPEAQCQYNGATITLNLDSNGRKGARADAQADADRLFQSLYKK